MRKNFIVKIMTAILLFAMSFTLVFVGDKAIEVEAAGKEQTATHVFSKSDINPTTNKVGVINSFMLDGGFEVQVLNNDRTPISGYTSGQGITFKSATFVTIKASTENNTLINFSVIRADSDPIAGTIDNGVISKNNVELDDGKSLILYTPIDGTKEMKIEFAVEERWIYSFSITYSLPHTHNYSDVFNFDSTNHWIECECGDKQSNNPHVIDGNYSYDDNSHWYGCETCKYKSEEQEHNFDNGVTTAPSITDAKPGKTVYTCQTCNYEKTVYSYLDINDEKISIYYKNTLTYNGQEQSQELNVYYDDVELTEGVHYTLSGNDATNAGDYTLTIKGEGSFSGEKNFNYTIAKASLIVTVNDKEIVYGDVLPNDYTVTITGFVNNENESIISGEPTFECNYEQFNDVDTYNIQADGYYSDNYSFTYVDGNLRVTPKPITLEWENTVLTYNGQIQQPTASFTGLVNGDTCDVVVSGAQTNVGENYLAMVTGLTDPNYKLATEGLFTAFSIVKGQAIIAVNTDDINVIYGNDITLPEATSNFGNVVKSEIDNTNVGEHIITYSIAETDNYYGATETVKVIISPLAVTEPTVKGSYIYTGNEQTVELNGLEAFMTIETGNNAKVVGNYTVKIKLDSNHVWADGSDGEISWSIEKSQATIAVNTDDINVIYGNDITLPEATSNFGNVVKSEIDNTNVGEHIITYSVAETDNYFGATKTVKVIISPLAVTEPTVKGSYIYTGNEQTVELNGLEAFMTIETGNNAKVVGNHTVKIKLDSNHVWADGSDGEISWSIDKATHDMSGVKFENVTVTYDGVEHVIEITGTLPEGVTVSYTNNKGKNAGTYNAVATFTYDTANYNTIADMNAVLTINKVKVALPEATTSFVYDGQAHTAVANHELYEVTGATETNAGSYEVTVTLKDTVNYEWAESFDGKISWTVNKATHNMSGIKFENVTVVYNGTEHVVEITGTLPKGVTVAYTNNKATNAGVYNAVATFTYDTANYNTIAEMTAVLTINKLKVALPDATTSFVYDGQAHTAVANHELYTVTGATQTNAGSYEATVTLNDTTNYEWAETFNGKVAWTITKATYDMSGIKFENVTVTYDGEEHVVEITGTLPEGVTVAYTTNAGTNAGTYNAVAKFTGDVNYNAIPDMNATITINKATYDMSGIKFENVTVTYDGEEHVVEITGTLPEGVTVAYTTNAGTNAGTYNAVAKFTGDVNYNAILDMNAVLTINKFKVALPETTTSFVYDGTAKVAVNTHDLYTVTEGSATNAGSYEAVVTLNDTANYEWAEEFNGKVAWTINKATHDMTNIKFENVTVVYNGTEYVIEITGTLPEGVTVSYTTNKGTNAGTYNALATFTYDTANYNTIADMNAVLTINKFKVALPEATTSFVYDGAAKVAVSNHELYTVEGATQTNAGTYEAVITLKDTVNYEWAEEFNGKVAWKIEKATHNMSNVKFENLTVVYNGTEYVIEITGTLPDGVTVAYTNNKGTNAGTYNAVATFTYDTANYNTIADMNAVLTINTDEHSYVNPETNVEDVIVSTEDGNGIDPNKEVKIEMVEDEVSSESFDEFLDKKERVAVAYDIKLIQDGVEVRLDGTLKIKILIPEELRNREFSIMHVHNGDETYMLEYEIEGDYVVFYTDKLSSFVFVYETGSILWLLIVFAVIVILEAGLLVFLLNKKKQFKLVKLAAAYPPFVFGMFLPAVQLVFFIILLVAIVALTTIDAIFGYELYGDKIKAFFKKDDNSKVIIDSETKVESSLDEEEIDPEDE